jgi:Ca-activated chloride channel homolog
MGTLNPLALLLLALAVPIIVLYMLRLRRREVVVSSRMLWTRILQDKQANAPWQRVQRNLLLLLQLALLALLVFALARPFVEVATAARGNIIVLLDSSASMQATDVPPNRFAAAKQKVSDLIDSLGSGDKLTLISVGSSSRVLANAAEDKAALHAALSNATVGNGGTNMADGLRLAASVARQAQDSTVVIVSDGAVGDLSKLPPLQATVRYIPIGGGNGSDNNQAITALAVRDGPSGPEALVSLANFASIGATGILTVSVDGQLWASKQVQLAAGQHSSITVNDLPRTAQIVTARIVTKDNLAADDSAYALRSNAKTSKALLISDGNIFIEKAMALLPNIQLDKVKPADFSSAEGYDLVIYDGGVPVLPASINTSLLLFNPAPSPVKPNPNGEAEAKAAAAFNVTGRLDFPQLGAVQVNDPIMRYVDLNAVQISTARKMLLPDWAKPLVLDRDGNPLIFAGNLEGRRIGVFTFDLHNSTLPLLVAYPLLISNMVGYLTASQNAGAELPPSLNPGEPITLPLQPDASRVTLTRPDGSNVDLPLGGGQAVYADTDIPGIYSVQQFGSNGPLGQPALYTVNLFDEQESNIRPQPTLSIAGQPAGAASGATSEREFWPLIITAALLLALVEWWIYFRGRRLPRLGRSSPAA